MCSLNVKKIYNHMQKCFDHFRLNSTGYTYYVYQQATDWAMYYLYFKRFRENSLTFFLENVAAKDNKNQFVLHKFVWIIATDKIITFGFICHSVMIHDFNKAKRSKNEKLHVSSSTQLYAIYSSESIFTPIFIVC